MKRIIAVLFCISLYLALQGTTTLALGQLCSVNVVNDSFKKSYWVARPALIRIQTTDFDIAQRTQVNFDANTERITAAVEGCDDTDQFELTIMNLSIPLSK